MSNKSNLCKILLNRMFIFLISNSLEQIQSTCNGAEGRLERRALCEMKFENKWEYSIKPKQ